MPNVENFNLTPRERKFCEEYLRTGKKKEAAIYAGFKENSAANAATRMLKKEECLAYIRDIQRRAREELHIDDNWAVLRAIDVYNRCMSAVPVMEWDYKTHQLEPTGEYTFDSKGALKALELIKSLLGLGEDDNSKLFEAITFIEDIRTVDGNG